MTDVLKWSAWYFKKGRALPHPLVLKLNTVSHFHLTLSHFNLIFSELIREVVQKYSLVLNLVYLLHSLLHLFA